MRVFPSRWWILAAILLAFWIVSAAHFIFKTSHIAIDGVRYFSVFDDGMIGMRYAKNLVEHHALVWNLGDRVEGITDPLWILIMAGSIRLCGTHLAPLAMQIVGGLICLSTFIAFFSSATHFRTGYVPVFAGLLLLMTSYPISYWGLTGMEACAICLITTIALSAQCAYEYGTRKNPLLVHSLLIAVAYCLRPDGWLVLAPLFAASWFDCVRAKSYWRALLALILPSAVILGLLLARVAYYGEWVPNTYILKMQGYSLALRWKNGIAYCTPFCKENFGIIALIALAMVIKKRIAYLNGLVAAIAIAYQVYVGGDPWLFWRQLLPVYVAGAFALLILFKHFSDVATETQNDASRLKRADLAKTLVLTLLPFALLEGFVAYSHSGIDSVNRIPLLIGYLLFAALATFAAGNQQAVFIVVSNRPVLILSVKVIILILVSYSVLLGNLRFRYELSANKPYLFDGAAIMLDKAVLAKKLFGNGKTHHLVWAGTYPYYVEGAMIDSLGKSDKIIARYPVDEELSWDGMHGVPGHAKYNFRESILRRNPDIVVDFTRWGSQDVSAEMVGKYVLIQSADVRLCVKKELSVGIEPLLNGNCPPHF